MFGFINRAIVTVQAYFGAREQGQALVEYGLVVGLVSLAALVGAVAMGGGLSTFFTEIGQKLTALAGSSIIVTP